MLLLSPIFTGMPRVIENSSRTARNMVRCGKKLHIKINELYEGKPSLKVFPYLFERISNECAEVNILETSRRQNSLRQRRND